MTLAIFPGSFDPITLGHIDIIDRASKVFSEVRVLLVHNSKKQTMFTVQERLDLIREATEHLPSVTVDAHEGLTVEYVSDHKGQAMIRGLRGPKDFEYEMNVAAVNRKFAPEIETLFMATSGELAFISSTIVKEAAKYNRALDELVPKNVELALIAKR
ncbi:pantetheine-phosphate adenylyltransferase [Alkalicoccobacillus murimartini]|uniref:Phosphopantetheine adenylyltransferase n=1 Tax=Alkalicoccobacillus murimartini TaxID=171685 RepID=A0ABT9YF38_9BACI|nr:pantetheine-phosphate adenylyltransferase [Alkalicoccobacillus murimartini]MDQ0206464.1 pantetheine-phosphate adenylyltransferase [Alkalicoccobacillus murimartini]